MTAVTITKDTRDRNGWVQGRITIDGTTYRMWAKVYDEPSDYGINSGRVSKLQLRPLCAEEWVFIYDRGMDINPFADEQVTAMANAIEAAALPPRV